MRLSATAIKGAAVGIALGVAGTYLALSAGGVPGEGARGGAAALAAASAGAGTVAASAKPAAAAKGRYVCPMGDYEGDRPGRCPVCGMKLEKAAAPKPVQPPGHGHEMTGEGKPGMSAGERASGASPSVAPAKDAVKWICPMGHIVTDKPGTCPVCGMKLIKQTVGQPSGGGAALPGTIAISAEKQQQIGVRTAPVVHVTTSSAIRAAGKVEMDESRVSVVHTKSEGWIEDLLVATTGQPVRQGQPLLTIYSPDLVAAQEEYLQAARTERDLAGSTLLPAGAGLLTAAARRLRNLDFGEQEMESLRKTGVPRRAATLHAPRGGIVLEKKAVAGMRVMPGDELFTIADLSSAWVLAQVYESELPFVKVGHPAQVQLAALPGQAFRGRVTFIYPTLDPMTRTARVRVVLANPGLVLKPEMYAAVSLEAPAQRHLAIPTEAVLDSGTRQVAFVARPGGFFEPRELKLGGYKGDLAIVRGGLHPGERVVTSANFLIDSESQLQAAMGAMGGGHDH